MPSPKSDSLVRRLALIAMTAALAVGFSASTAFAEGPEIFLSPAEVNTTEFPEPVEIAVTGAGFEPYDEENVRVGVCAFPPVEGVPPCGAFAEDVSIVEDALSATIELEDETIPNDHDDVTPNQPPNFTCGESNCVVLAAHHLGVETETLDFEALPFKP